MSEYSLEIKLSDSSYLNIKIEKTLKEVYDIMLNNNVNKPLLDRYSNLIGIIFPKTDLSSLINRGIETFEVFDDGVITSDEIPILLSFIVTIIKNSIALINIYSKDKLNISPNKKDNILILKNNFEYFLKLLIIIILSESKIVISNPYQIANIINNIVDTAILTIEINIDNYNNNETNECKCIIS